MGIFDFFHKDPPKKPTQTTTYDVTLKKVIASTNNMLKTQLIICVNPTITYEDLFEDVFFLGYFYGMHDAAFQMSGHRKPQEEMYVTYMLAIGDFCNAKAHVAASPQEVAEELFGLMSWLCANESSDTFQRAQMIAGTEYYDLMEGRARFLVGLMNHFLPPSGR